jgi:hypothetical protein
MSAAPAVMSAQAALRIVGAASLQLGAATMTAQGSLPPPPALDTTTDYYRRAAFAIMTTGIHGDANHVMTRIARRRQRRV